MRYLVPSAMLVIISMLASMAGCSKGDKPKGGDASDKAVQAGDKGADAKAKSADSGSSSKSTDNVKRDSKEPRADSKPKVAVAPLQGKITFDGKPVRYGVVTAVSPDGTRQGKTAVTEEGTYRIDNAPLGKVLLVYIVRIPPDGEGFSKEMQQHFQELRDVPDHYKDLDHTPLHTTVVEGKDNTYDMLMTRKKRVAPNEDKTADAKGKAGDLDELRKWARVAEVRDDPFLKGGFIITPIDGKATQKEFATLKNYPELTGVYILHHSDADLVFLKDLPDLQFLGFDEAQGITDAGLTHLKGLKKLKVLVLDGMEKITDDGLAHVKGLASLQMLSLFGTDISSKGLAHLKGLTELEKLVTGGPGIDDSGIGHLAGLQKLKELAIDNSKITDKGMLHLQGLKKLTRLSLSRSPGLTDAGIDHLQGLTNLRGVNLSDTKVTGAGIERLKKALPKVEVLK